MKRYLQTLVFFVVTLSLLPLLLSAALNFETADVMKEESLKMNETSSDPSKPSGDLSVDESSQPPKIRVLNTKTDELLTMELESLCVGVLYAEMPASFEREALKAQAIAIRSFILYSLAHPINDGVHPDADICTDHNHCMAYRSYDDAVEAYGVITADDTYPVMLDAVESTRGIYLSYNGEVANSVFHAASVGKTESCARLWGGEFPYLVSVNTPESETEFLETKSFLPSELKSLIHAVDPTVEFGAIPRVWFGDIERNDSGRVDELEICGAILTGNEMRTALGLRSTNFSVDINDGYFTFTTVGYGHGVGLSQYGAELLAKSGEDFRSILLHYYTGVSLAELNG